MPRKPTPSQGTDSEFPEEVRFQSASFPSDVLSVKRFRKLFPDHFDQPDLIRDGYPNNDFFFPSAAEKPDHLMKLTQLICDERTIAAGAYYRCFLKTHPDALDEEELRAIASSKATLEKHYQFFKLADGPESARLLIRQVEEEGEKLARKQQGKAR